MKKIILVALILTFFISCGDNEIQLKNFKIHSAKISNNYKLINSNEGAFSYPKFGKNSDKIFFSTVNYSGIFYYDLKNKSINNLIDSKGTGLDFVQNENDVFFVLPALSERTNKRIFSIAKQNLDSKKIEIIYKSDKGIKSLNIIDDYLGFFVDDSAKFYDLKNNLFVEKSEVDDVLIFTAIADELLIFDEGEIKRFIPFKGFMINNLKEIDDKNLLIEIAGKGAYKFSLENYQTEFLTDSIIMIDVLKNSNLAVGMQQKNDGLMETKSEIFLFDLNTKELFNLTTELNITALNPSLNNNGSKLVFNSMEGNIYLMSLKISEGQVL